ncbi:unnamed protein product, partial [Candidula unifasciata]
VPVATGDLTLVQLQEMASRQQQVVETQQQVLVAKEQRLKYLKQQELRHAQLASESERLRKIRERVENQELKLKKLRALRGQAEQYRISNGNLTNELEAVKTVFSEKEKELAMAVAKVDQLTRQLKDLKNGSNSGMYSNKQATLNSEVDKLRKELMMRNKLNEQQSNTITNKEKLLKERREKIAAMDAKIHELHQQLKQKQQQQQQSSAQSNKAIKLNGQHPQNGGVAPTRVPHQSQDAKESGGFAKHDMRNQALQSDIKSGENYSTKQQDTNRNELIEEYKLPGVLPVDNSASLHQNLPRQSFGYSNKPPPPARTSKSTGILPDSVPNQNINISKTGQTPNSVSGLAMFGSHFFPAGQQQKSLTSLGGAGDSSGQNGGFPDSDASNSAPRFFQTPTSSSSLPSINISDEERQAGSGQSSPACSESSPSATSGVPVKNEVNTSSVGPVSALIDKLNKSVGRPDEHNLPLASVAGPRRSNFTQRSHIPSQNGNTSSQIPGKMAATGSQSEASRLNTQSLAIGSPPQLLQDETDSSHHGSDSVDISSASASSVNPTGLVPTPNPTSLSSNSGLHLNQKPALTYRYASKNAIANTYMGRLGSAAMDKYQRNLNMLYQSVDSQGSRPTAEDVTPFTQSSPADALSTGQDDPQFGAGVTSPSYPDIASDKGSFKLHTPKQVRRRHSDSENEDLNKALQEQQEREQQQRLQQKQQQQRLQQQQQILGNIDSQALIDTEPSSPSLDKSKPPTGKDKTVKNTQQVSVDKKPPESTSSPQAAVSLQKNESNKSPAGGTRSASSSVSASADPVPKQTKSNLKKGGRRSNNRVSFDPLALLLDASLEGELDLVRKVALQVDDVSTPNDEGITALHNAICAGHYDIVTVLVELGCDVNAPDSDGWTPLHCAASCNNLPMVRFLVEHGACVFATTISDHETAADKCEEDEDGYDSCSDYLYSIQEKLGIVNNGEVYAVFDYQATNTDELSFQNGNKLMVLRKGDETEKEWWWAQLNGREGYIPRNLLGVMLISACVYANHPRTIMGYTSVNQCLYIFLMFYLSNLKVSHANDIFVYIMKYARFLLTECQNDFIFL